MPRYDEGDIILVWATPKLPLENFYGEEAAVLMDSGTTPAEEDHAGSAKNTVELHFMMGESQ